MTAGEVREENEAVGQEAPAGSPPSADTADTADTGDREHRHAVRMARKKAVHDRLVAARNQERGLLIVHTGKGKGKTTAALGMVLRAIGHGLRVGVVQFGKGQRTSGERLVLARFPEFVELYAHGEGFTWETQDRARDQAAAGSAWEAARRMITDPGLRIVVLDELNIVLRYGYLPLDQVLAVLAARPPMTHVVVTGRNAAPELIAAADLVTEMTLIKHPFREGVKAQAGIEY